MEIQSTVQLPEPGKPSPSQSPLECCSSLPLHSLLSHSLIFFFFSSFPAVIKEEIESAKEHYVQHASSSPPKRSRDLGWFAESPPETQQVESLCFVEVYKHRGKDQ